MQYIYMANMFEDNSQLTPFVIGIAVCVIIGLIIATVIIHIRDKRKEKLDDEIDTAWKAEQVVNRVEVLNRKNEKKKIRQIKRDTRDPKKKAEDEAASKNTLLGGKSEAQREEKEAREVFGSLGISSKKAEEIDKAKEQIIINGYLQKSNTAPIRPVYSNTLEARQQQRKELDSNEVGKEAETPALVMDSAAPSEVKITEAPAQKVKPTALKRPTAARVEISDDAPVEDETYSEAIRPQIGTEVSNAEIVSPAEVQAEKPDILKSGEEAIIPAATEVVKGFLPNEEVLEQNKEEKAEKP
ncbi:hypothetical protein B0O40_2539 [Ruminococcaceae bacterium R-25]|nr:hypothetical protein B0O40_2539 [Ruminococcaceae bacterium R-25]SUQ22390.1 hypothetical protein SAMN06297423_2539 [Oscillospiraceae bacterium]